MNRNDTTNKNKKSNVLNKIKDSYNNIILPSHFEISANREALIDGCRELLEYSDTSIKINMGKFIAVFLGRGLSIKCLNENSLLIYGYITTIEFIT